VLQRSTNDQLAHEEMFNFLSHKINTNQNDTKIPSYPSQIGNHLENKQDAGGRGKNPHTLLVGMSTSTTTIEVSMEVLQKLKNRSAL
jgi:hypothetical protein